MLLLCVSTPALAEQHVQQVGEVHAAVASRQERQHGGSAYPQASSVTEPPAPTSYCVACSASVNREATAYFSSSLSSIACRHRRRGRAAAQPPPLGAACWRRPGAPAARCASTSSCAERVPGG